MSKIIVNFTDRKAIDRVLELIGQLPEGPAWPKEHLEIVRNVLNSYVLAPRCPFDPDVIIKHYIDELKIYGESVVPLSAILTARLMNLRISRQLEPHCPDSMSSWTVNELDIDVFDYNAVRGDFSPFSETDLVGKDTEIVRKTIREWLETLSENNFDVLFCDEAISQFDREPEKFYPPAYPVFDLWIKPCLHIYYLPTVLFLYRAEEPQKRKIHEDGTGHIGERSLNDIKHPYEFLVKGRYIHGVPFTLNVSELEEQYRAEGTVKRYKAIMEILKDYPPTVDPRKFVEMYLAEILERVEKIE